MRGLRSGGHGLGPGACPEARHGRCGAHARHVHPPASHRDRLHRPCAGGGGLLLLSADARIGAEGEFKIGLPEVAIRMTLPIFGVELARDRLARNHLTAAVTQARIYNPVEAALVGYLDQTAPAERLRETALARARELALLPQPAFRNTKLKERSATVKLIRDTLMEDLRTFDGATR
ncbi:enoyl-CoA hydratase [Parvibaculum sedimenti]|uniref:Enoyl-CoA hydratase n=1 Tax=Parvibaculum sedimenti TaxID=2608632 RepID=A0A6N6VKY3_9HYPH|nr:enoyl-CoA hydratase [Parvibaculum sedimenti]